MKKTDLQTAKRGCVLVGRYESGTRSVPLWTEARAAGNKNPTEAGLLKGYSAQSSTWYLPGTPVWLRRRRGCSSWSGCRRRFQRHNRLRCNRHRATSFRLRGGHGIFQLPRLGFRASSKTLVPHPCRQALALADVLHSLLKVIEVITRQLQLRQLGFVVFIEIWACTGRNPAFAIDLNECIERDGPFSTESTVSSHSRLIAIDKNRPVISVRNLTEERF